VEKSKNPADLTAESSKITPQLSDRDLDKVTGGTVKIANIQGPSTRDGHEDEIEIHS
jgi:hypothetical protein